MEHRMSKKHSARAILAILVLALAILLASLSSGHWWPAAAQPGAPASTKVQLPSGPNSTSKPEQAENGPKQCVGPHEIEGPLC